MRLHVIDLGWVEYVTLRYVVSACTGRLICEILQKFILPIVYNGLSATIFCVTRKIAHIATRLVSDCQFLKLCFKNVCLSCHVFAIRSAVPCARKVIFCPACPVVFQGHPTIKQSKAKMCNGRRHVPLCPACANKK